MNFSVNFKVILSKIYSASVGENKEGFYRGDNCTVYFRRTVEANV